MCKLLLLLIILFKRVGSARLGESENNINPKTPTPHNHPKEGIKKS